jgi:hypothetical protein
MKDSNKDKITKLRKEMSDHLKEMPIILSEKLEVHTDKLEASVKLNENLYIESIGIKTKLDLNSSEGISHVRQCINMAIDQFFLRVFLHEKRLNHNMPSIADDLKKHIEDQKKETEEIRVATYKALRKMPTIAKEKLDHLVKVVKGENNG